MLTNISTVLSILSIIAIVYSDNDLPSTLDPDIDLLKEVEITNLVSNDENSRESPAEIFNETSTSPSKTESNVVFTLPRIDWTPWLAEIKNRKLGNLLCESSWAITTSDVIEGNLNLQLNFPQPVKISARELMDCANPNVDPCDDTLNDIAKAMGYVLSSGIDIDDVWPYIGSNTQSCISPLNDSGAEVKVKQENILDPNPEDRPEEGDGSEELDMEVNSNRETIFFISDYLSCQNCEFDQWINWLSKGPIATYIDSIILTDYEEGVLESVKCKQPNLKVVVVGYDPESDAFIVRNSLGQYWGENGYFRVKRDMTTNSCFLTSYAYLPIIN